MHAFSYSRKPRSRYDLALLINPQETDPPSNARALRQFARAAEEVGFSTEVIGKAEYGKGAQYWVEGKADARGECGINTSGGLIAKGHPVGATGVAQVIEIVSQLRGDAGQRQVQGARIGLAQNMGGSGGSSIVHIMEVA